MSQSVDVIAAKLPAKVELEEVKTMSGAAVADQITNRSAMALIYEQILRR
jgi:hypothetical protein